MRLNVKEKIVGDTLKTTWVSSGAAPDSIGSTLYDSGNAIVSSVAAISSGNGAFYALHQLPNLPGYYVNEWVATLSGKVYRTRQLIHANDVQVD